MSQVTDPERSRTSIPLSTTLSANRMGRGIRVRYAPSPTGVPHIGGIRTALFNFLFAKNQKGVFLLRIEDTDQKRLVPGSLELIKKSLELLNLEWDEYYLQSERLEIYQKYLNLLKDKGVVYEDEGAWRFRVEKGKILEWVDQVHGKVQFSSDVIEDFIIIKSDKFPTYHFANVIDDTEMKISHVLRGDEWLASTPKHLLLYDAFGWQPPNFTHMPLILGHDKKKLSKRQGAKSVIEYINEGYLPQAIINFLAFLGWVPKDEREIFSLAELAEIFSLDRINKNSPIFNLEKLNWFNMQWIKKTDDKSLASVINIRFNKYDVKKLALLMPLVKVRMKKLTDFPGLANFLFEAPNVSDIPEPLVSPATISNVSENFANSQNWSAASIKSIIDETASDAKEDRVATIATIRNIISGSTVTPPLYESLEYLGKVETVKRLNDYLKAQKK